ncbi:hypothetical protein D3C73_1501440 [compost metagenome]
MFKDRQFDAAMTGIDAMGFIMVTVIMLAVVVVISLLELEHLLATPGTPEHPQRNHNDQRARGKLEVRLSGFGVQTFTQVHAANGDQPHHSGVRKRSGQAQ